MQDQARWRTVVGAIVSIFLFGCGGADESSAGSTSSSESVPPSRIAGPGLGPSGAATGRFGLGRLASPEEIAVWDIDVSPDGTGLPPGSGSVEDGAEVYLADCAPCHGPNGEGGPNDALVGSEPRGSFPFGSTPGLTSTIGNYWPYSTTVFDYIRRAMPFDRPGSLSNDEVYAVTAWLLWRNDLISEDAVMDATSLPEVRMPAREFFVPSEDVRLPALP